MFPSAFLYEITWVQTNRTAKKRIKSAANCHLIVIKTLRSAEGLPMDKHSYNVYVEHQIEYEFDVEGEVRILVEPFIHRSQCFVRLVQNTFDINERLNEKGLPS